MDEDFIESVLKNWASHVRAGRLKKDSTFYAVTVDERAALVHLGFKVENGWCTPPPNYARN